MSAQVITTASPRWLGRLAGLFYLGTGLVGFDVYGVVSKLVFPGQAAAMASNILAHETLFRAGAVAELLGISSYVVVTALFYALFKPVSASLSFVAALFGVMGCAIQAVSVTLHFAPLVLLSNESLLSIMSNEELQALALLCVRLYNQGLNIGILFFGFYYVLIGWLILRSTFLPKVIGVLMLMGGLAYVIFCIAAFLSPPLGKMLSRFILIFGGLGEGSLMLWLIVAGVNPQRWYEQAGRRMPS